MRRAMASRSRRSTNDSGMRKFQLMRSRRPVGSRGGGNKAAQRGQACGRRTLSGGSNERGVGLGLMAARAVKRIGLIGVGKHGSRYARHIRLDLPDLELVAIA